MCLFIFHLFIIILLLIISVITAHKTGIKVGMNNTHSIDYGYIFFILKNKIKVWKLSIFVCKNTVGLSIDGIPPDFDSDLFLEIAELPATSNLETVLMEYQQFKYQWYYLFQSEPDISIPIWAS